MKVDRGDGNHIHILVQTSNLDSVKQAVSFFFDGQDLSFLPSMQLPTCEMSSSNLFILHMLGHRCGNELQILRNCGFSNHSDFESDVKRLCRFVYDDAVLKLRPECWDEWMTKGGLETELMHSRWCLKGGSSVEIRVRYLGFDGDISITFYNKNEPNSLYITVQPSPQWFEGVIGINQAYRVCKYAEELSNALNHAKQRTMTSLILTEKCQQEYQLIKAELREFFFILSPSSVTD